MNALIQLVRALAIAAALAHGVPPEHELGIIDCETGGTYRPDIVSRDGRYFGLDQLAWGGEMEWFRTRQIQQGLTPDWADPAQSANYLAEQLADGHETPWPVCRYRWLRLP